MQTTVILLLTLVAAFVGTLTGFSDLAKQYKTLLSLGVFPVAYTVERFSN